MMANIRLNPTWVALNTAIRLAKLVSSNGKFIYSYNSETNEVTERYNILRHSGCVWALNASQFDVLYTGIDISPASERAMHWLSQHRIIAGPTNGICVSEDGEVKVGANALAVLAFVSMAKNISSYYDIVRNLCEYMISEWKETGGFIHKRALGTWQEVPFRSNYYDGEVLFSLFAAGIRFNIKSYIDRAYSNLSYFVERNIGIYEQSHWMMYAVAASMSVGRNIAFERYADDLIGNILKEVSYRDRRECTPIACRTEALLCYLHAKQKYKWHSPIEVIDVLREVKINLQLQFSDYLHDGSFRRGMGSNIVRIDYLQHNLMSFLSYSKFLTRRYDCLPH